jgi:hypothetical protein
VTQTFKTIAGELSLPQIGVHGLRHTAATWNSSRIGRKSLKADEIVLNLPK